MSRYSEYLQQNFAFSPQEAEEIIQSMKQPLKKSIHINTQKISVDDFKLHAKEQGWQLTSTDIPEVFYIDRDDTTIALGNTLEHQAGWFYIQEVAAAHPPFLLKEKLKIKKEKFDGIILDICAAPGGKTTQLADYFPESLIIANEANRGRTPQLFENLDRMGYDNVVVISCDGRFLQNFPAFFDMVLLDAPCSGEGTAFRDDAVLNHWHEKNISRIAKLQKQLFQTAINVVKPGGFVSYSTCTLNKEENEEIIELGMKKKEGREDCKKNPVLSPSSFDLSSVPQLEKLYTKRYWPHIDHTGGFFASIFQKKQNDVVQNMYPLLSLRGQKQVIRPTTKGEQEMIDRFISKHFHTTLKKGFCYMRGEDVYFSRWNLTPLSQYFFFVYAGTKIGTIQKNIFTPSNHLLWYVEDISHIPVFQFSREQYEQVCLGNMSLEKPDGWYQIKYGEGIIGIRGIKDGNFLG